MAEKKWHWNGRTVGRITTALAVGAFAAYSSYEHMRSLALVHGQTHDVAAFLPISVDGLIVFGTWNMDALNRFWPRLSFWLGVLATISANLLAAPPDLTSKLISAWAPISLLCVIETWSRRNQTGRWVFDRKAAVETEPVAADVPMSQSSGQDEPVKPRTRNARGAETEKKVTKIAARNPGAPITKIAAQAGVSEKTARTYLAPQTPADVPA